MATVISLSLMIMAETGLVAAQDDATAPTRAVTPFDVEKAKYNADVAQEKKLVAELTALIEQAAAIEKRLTETPPAAQDTRTPAEKARDAQIRRLSNEIRATLDERFKLALDVVQLETEAKILRDIFDEITNGTTSISTGLRFAEVTMRQLAKGGVIKPRRTRFTTVYQLRNAIANARQALGTARAKDKARKAGLDQKLERLDIRLDALLHADVSQPGGGAGDVNPDILAWLTAQQEIATKNQELNALRDRLMAYHWSSINAAAGSGPAHLQNVTLSTPHIVYYDAGWHKDGDATQAAATNQQELLNQISKQQLLIATIKQSWIELAAHRLPLAREMHRRAKLLETMAEAHAVIERNSIISNAIVDGAVSVAGVMITGGTATLGAKLASIQDDLTTKHATSLASVSDDAATRSLHLLGYPAHKSNLFRLHTAAKMPREAFEEAYVIAAEQAARRQGRNVAEATAQATKEIKYMLQRIPVDKRLREAAVALNERVRLRQQLSDGVRQTIWAGNASTVTQSALPHDVFNTTAPWKAVAGVVVSDGIGLAAQIAMSGGARPGNLKSVTTWAAQQTKLRKFNSLLSNNFYTIAPTVIGTVTKGLVTAAYQDWLNETITAYWTEYAHIAFLGRILKEHQSIDRGMHDLLVQARLDLATLQAAYVASLAPPTFKIKTDGYLPDPEGQATLMLTFSNGLTKAPTVKVGDRTVTMTPHGIPADQPYLTRTFSGTLNFTGMEDGNHVLDVTLAPGTQPHAPLDSDPTTVPTYYSPAVDKWRNVEDGSDRRHKIVMNLEVHRTLGTLDALLGQMRERIADFEERYGSGQRDYDGGWGGMSKSLEQAHTRIGAPVKGDPDGIAWMRFNGLGLKGGAAHRYFDSLREFRDGEIGQLAWQMNRRMDDTHREYLAFVEERVGRWLEAAQAFHTLGDEWLDTLATYTKIGALPDPAEIERLARANEQALFAVEAEMKAHFPPALPRFEEWKAQKAGQD